MALPTDELQSAVKRKTLSQCSAKSAEAGKKRTLKRTESMIGLMNEYEALILNREENKTSPNELEKDETGLNNSATALISSNNCGQNSQ